VRKDRLSPGRGRAGARGHGSEKGPSNGKGGIDLSAQSEEAAANQPQTKRLSGRGKAIKPGVNKVGDQEQKGEP